MRRWGSKRPRGTICRSPVERHRRYRCFGSEAKPTQDLRDRVFAAAAAGMPVGRIAEKPFVSGRYVSKGPRRLVTDGLRSYGVAQRAILPDVRHRTSRY